MNDRIMIIVEWKGRLDWEFSAAFLEPKEANDYAIELQTEFPADDIRVVKKRVIVDGEVRGEVEFTKVEL